MRSEQFERVFLFVCFIHVIVQGFGEKKHVTSFWWSALRGWSFLVLCEKLSLKRRNLRCAFLTLSLARGKGPLDESQFLPHSIQLSISSGIRKLCPNQLSNPCRWNDPCNEYGKAAAAVSCPRQGPLALLTRNAVRNSPQKKWKLNVRLSLWKRAVPVIHVTMKKRKWPHLRMENSLKWVWFYPLDSSLSENAVINLNKYFPQ